MWWATRPAPLSFAVGDFAAGQEHAGSAGQRVEAPTDHGLPLRFSDGSLVTLDRGARVQVLALDRDGASLQIDSGRAEVNVHHRAHTRWLLRAGSFEVKVTGTRFSIDWQDKAQALTVMMTEGTVEVRGHHLPGGSPIIVTKGQRFRASAREPHWTLDSPEAVSAPRVVAMADAERGVAPDGERGPPSLAAAPTTPAAPGEAPAGAPLPPATSFSPRAGALGARSWQTLAAAGHYQEALAVAERMGFSRSCRRLGADAVVELGDVARLAQDVPRAEEAYRAARRRFPRTDRPAFAMGLIAFDQRKDFRRAARWFDTYLRDYPRGPLAREAAGRAMDAWNRAGDRTLASRAARDYLKRAPEGPYAPLARQIAAP
jgi:hypothetical protein